MRISNERSSLASGVGDVKSPFLPDCSSREYSPPPPPPPPRPRRATKKMPAPIAPSTSTPPTAATAIAHAGKPADDTTMR
jgi:hypothetical protein